MNKQRVPIFVDFTDEGLKFYAVHESIHCPTLYPKSTPKPQSLKDLAQPFTGLTSRPLNCSFTSVGDQFYLIGGSKPSSDQYNDDDDDDQFYLNGGSEPSSDQYDDTPVPDDMSHVSTRVKRFDFQSFVNSLADNQDKGKIDIVELDGNELSNGYWETCAPLSVARSGASVLHLGGKLYAVGGIDDCEPNVDYTTSFIEVFEDGVWTFLTTHNPPDISRYILISAALVDSNKILIGSNGAFYELNVGTARWEELVGLECPEKFVNACGGTPGVVVHNRFVMWFDQLRVCITGLDLSDRKHFYVDVMYDILGLKRKHRSDAQTAKLVDIGDEEGSISLICYVPTFNHALDDHERNTFLGEYHLVTFQIIFDKLAVENKPFPGVELGTRVISHHKCFAPMGGWGLAAAFAMDVCFPKRICPNTCVGGLKMWATILRFAIDHVISFLCFK